MCENLVGLAVTSQANSPPPSTLALSRVLTLARGNPLLRHLFDDRTRFLAVLDLAGTIVDVNAYDPESLRPPRESYLGCSIWKTSAFARDPAWEERWKQRLADALAAPEALVFDDEMAVENFGRRALRLVLSVIRDEAGEALGFFVNFDDVQAERQTAELLREQQSLRQLVFDQSFQLMALLEPDGTIIDVNVAITRIGLTRAAVVGRRLQDVALEADGVDRARDWQERIDHMQTATQPLLSFDTRPGVGGLLASDCAMTPVRDEAGELTMILLELRDQTERFEIEARLRSSEQRFRALAEAVPQMLWSARADGEVDYFAPGWADFTGRSVDSLLGAGFVELVHPDDRAIVTHATAGNFDKNAVVFRMLRHDGRYRWLEARMSGEFDDGGVLIRWVGATLDITERVEAEEEDRKRQEQLRAMLKLTGYGTYAWYVKEDRFSRDSQLEEVLGIPMEEMMTANAFERYFALVHPEDRERSKASVLGALQPGGPDYDAEFRIFAPGPEGPRELWVSAIGRVEFDDRGEPFRLVGIFADVTDKRREDEGRLRTQKLEAIGTLASGIAHDFNNVIGAILSYARVAEAEVRAGEAPSESLSEIARGAHRAADIVQRLLTFSRDDVPRREAFDLAEVVDEASALVRPTIPQHIEIHMTASRGLPHVFGNPTQFHQLVVNLLNNAGQAIGDAVGHIEVELDSLDVGPQGSGVAKNLKPGRYVRLICRDDGPGMSDEVARRVFDPFFTTKPAGSGTGLGLAAVQSIVNNHGGAVTVDSRPGAGARFTVYVPAAKSAEPEVQAVVEARAMPQAGIRVLFVDDEQALVRLAHRAMPYHGCLVTGHTDPVEAASEFERDPDAFDALVTDLSMPGMTGLELTARIRAMRPDLPVVMTSGFMGTEERAAAATCGVDVIIPKPCAIDDLASAVQRLLAARGRQ